MKIVYSNRAIDALKDAPLPVQRAFELVSARGDGVVKAIIRISPEK